MTPGSHPPKIFPPLRIWLLSGMVPALLLGPGSAPLLSAPDEIQVYCDDLNRPGESELEIHTNYVSSGRGRKEYDGERPPLHILRVTPEYSIGLAKNWDIGFYLPTAYDGDQRAAKVDGAKFRFKYLRNSGWGSGTVFYGLNTEIGYSERRIDEVPWNSEFRGIMGIRQGPWLAVLNPVVELAWIRGSTATLDTQLKLGREIGKKYSIGFEHYAGWGPVGRFDQTRNQDQSSYLIMEYDGGGWEFHAGLGHGWTPASDSTVIKAIITFPFRSEADRREDG